MNNLGRTVHDKPLRNPGLEPFLQHLGLTSAFRVGENCDYTTVFRYKRCRRIVIPFMKMWSTWALINFWFCRCFVACVRDSPLFAISPVRPASRASGGSLHFCNRSSPPTIEREGDSKMWVRGEARDAGENWEPAGQKPVPEWRKKSSPQARDTAFVLFFFFLLLWRDARSARVLARLSHNVRDFYRDFALCKWLDAFLPWRSDCQTC